jgi:hypothetical protein
MKLSRKKIVFIAIVAALFVIDRYPLLRFRGDGRLSGGPVLGYWIRMRRIPLGEPGEYVFHFRGAPNEEMNLQLYAEGMGLANGSEIASLKTNIEVFLRDQSGRIICEADGSPSGGRGNYGNSSKGWVTMMGPDEAAYWKGNCLGMRLKPSSSYSLTIHIKDIDPGTPKINLVPTLEGGQPELT